MLNIPTPISEQLRMIKILSALVLLLFLKIFPSNALFEMVIANVVVIKYICSIKASTGRSWKSDFEGCHRRASMEVSAFVGFMFTKNLSDSSSKFSFSSMRNVISINF